MSISDIQWTEQYSLEIWIGSIIMAVITLPVGIIIPAYFALKSYYATGIYQSAFEGWTIILLGALGILAVELGGKKGAKISLVFAIGVLFLFVVIFIAFGI